MSTQSLDERELRVAFDNLGRGNGSSPAKLAERILYVPKSAVLIPARVPERPKSQQKYSSASQPGTGPGVSYVIIWSGPPTEKKAPSRLWERFLRLGTKPKRNKGNPAMRILGFGQQWGPLRAPANKNGESIAQWEKEIRIARAIIKIGSRLKTGGLGRKADWETLQSTLGVLGDVPGAGGMSRETDITLLYGAVEKWYGTATGHVILTPSLRIQPGASGVLGVVMFQVMEVLQEINEVSACKGCRKVLSGRERKYCKRCRDSKVPQRDAMRRMRVRKMQPQLFLAASRRAESSGIVIRMEDQSGAGRRRFPADQQADQLFTKIQDHANAIKKPWRREWKIIVDQSHLPAASIKALVASLKGRHGTRFESFGVSGICLVGPTVGLTFWLFRETLGEARKIKST